ncbi:endonuclease [bacterium SCSIO 12643]|nr:endonuclease [bacterium SCSIO 12643]
MKKSDFFTLTKCTLIAFTLLLSNLAFAQIPSGYYNSANGLTGNALKSALNDIIDGHTEYPYSSSGTDVWDILKIADRDPNNANNVIGLYSGFSMNAAAEYDGGAGWNREHVWAKSRGDFGTSKGAGTDLHHLRAADVSTNSARNNRNFDEAPTQYVDGSGNYSGTTDSYTSSTDWVWEPRDEIKGDVARMIFYMTVRYEGENGEVDLELTDNLLSSTDKTPFHGKASVLVQWHLDDPVSSEEIARNNVIYGYQGNRNPFIDHPEYVCEIYGSYCSGSGNGNGNGGGNGSDLFISEYIEGSSYNKGLEVANTTGSSVDLSSYSLKKQTNGSGSWGSEYTLSGTLNNNDVFVIVHSSSSSTMKAVADVQTSSGIVTFNGNDPIGLFKNGVLIDIIGTYNGGSSHFAQNTTLVRKETVSGPNTTHTTTEWDNHASNTFTYLGAHTSTSGGSGSGSGSSEIYISEYIEGSSYNKGLEIANTTGSSVDLSSYSLKKQTNGSGSWSSEYTLSGTLNTGDVFVIVHSSSSSTMKAVADVQTSSGIVSFNGNDPIGLFKNGVLIDIVGTYNGGSSNFAKDVTLVRNVTEPNTTYTTAEWDSHSSNTFTYLGISGTGQFKAALTSTPSFDAIPELQVYPNPVEDVLTISSSENEVESVMFYDVTGKVVFASRPMQNTAQIDVSSFEKGFYVVRIYANAKYTTQKLTIL